MEPPPGPRPVPPPRRTASGEHRAASPPGGEPRACWERAPERARGPHRESAVTQTVLIVLEKRGEMAPTQAVAQLEMAPTQAAAQLKTTRRPSIETASGTAPTQAAAQLGTTRSPATETATGTAMETATGTAMETATGTAMETATETAPAQAMAQLGTTRSPATETATETAATHAAAQLGTTRSPATETATEMAPTQAMAQLGTTQSPAMETATEKQAMAQLGTTQSSATETTMVQLDRTPTQAMARHRKMQIPATETTSETATAKYEITPTQAMEQSPPMETVKLKMTPMQAMVQHGTTQSPATAQNRTTQRHVTVQHETTTAHATVQHRTMLSPVTVHQETIPSHTMAQLQTVQSHATGQQKPMLSPATVQLETTQSPATTPHKAMLSNVTPQYETAKSHTMEYDITPEQSRATHTMPQHEMMQACKTPEKHDTSHHDMAQSHTTLHNTAQLEMLQNHAIQHLLTVQHETAQSHITHQSEIQQYKTDSYDTMQSHKLTQNCVLPQQDDRELSRMAPLQSSNQQDSSTLIQHGSAMQGTTVQSSATLQDKHVLQSHGKPDSDGIVQSNVTLKLDSKITQQGYNVSPSSETLQSHQSPQQSNTLMDTESHTPSYVQSQEDNSTTCVVSLARDRIKQRNVLKSNLSTSNTPPADGCVSVASGDLLQKDVTAAQDKVLTNVKGATHGELIPSSPSKTSHGFSEQTLVTKEEPRCTSGMLPHSFPQVAPAYAGQAPSHSSSELSTLTTGEAQSSSTSEVNPVSLKETPSHTYLVEASVSTSGSPSHSNPGAAPLSTGGIPARSSPGAASLSSTGASKLSPVRVHDPSSPLRNKSSKPPLPTPPRSNLYPGPPPSIDSDSSFRHETASLASYRSKPQAPDTLSYLDSVSLMSGTMESLSMLDDASSLGSDSEINGMTCRKTDKYGFLGGNQYSGNGESNIPVEIARQRELKWLDMFNHWDKWLSRRFQKVKLRCRKGIPSSLRSKAWQLLSNSHDLLLKNPGKFEEMERQPGDPKWLDVIEKDLHRQFPFHEMFAARGGHGQQDLFRILKAYTIYRPEEGYCQAQAPVAAVLLMHMPAEQAFWCLVQICDKYLPGYYSAGLVR
ncbi:TBC1 domain family member 10B [Pelobates cultripes]|uniref:TBC1 domain family member 10B n=1 Tax=Pelobates cultripes TaxID=61616 RepID=A0AAD1SRQ5_PELCU|nr:TBC1 domain family member 10B [Pelobates cultripes]